MTKAEQARVVAWRLKILQHAENRPRQVAQTGRYFGISRTAFYRWKKRFERLGEAGLRESLAGLCSNNDKPACSRDFSALMTAIGQKRP